MTLPMGPFQSVSMSKQKAYNNMLSAIHTAVLRGSHDRLNNAAGQMCKWQRPRFKKSSARVAVTRTCTSGRSLVRLPTVRSFDSPHITTKHIRIKSAPFQAHPPLFSNF